MRQSKVAVLGVAILANGWGPSTVEVAVPAGPGDGVRLAGRWFEEPVRSAVRGASRRLSDPSCAAVLDEFRDAAGRTLRARLGELDVEASAYARMVLFYDGGSSAPCRRPRTYAFTAPGSRVVRACPALGWLAASAPEQAEAVVIHEVLHTLGLGENPPRSDEITARVERRCRRSPGGDARRIRLGPGQPIGPNQWTGAEQSTSPPVGIRVESKRCERRDGEHP